MKKSTEAGTGLYCIGSALVDYEIKVDDAYLEKTQIEKGRMTLVDEETLRHHFEKNLSHLVTDRAGGGSAVNSLVTYARLGGEGSLCCKLADDASGHFFKSELTDLGISVIGGIAGEMSAEMSTRPSPTGHCLVLITPDAERTMLTHLGINHALNAPSNLSVVLAERALFYAETYLIAGDNTYESLIRHLDACGKSEIQTSISMSDVSMVKGFRERMQSVLEKQPHILFGNKEEYGEYTGQDEPDKMAARLDGKVDTLILTNGEHGSYIYHAGKKSEVPALRVHAVDTLGAGDAYAGTFLYAMQERKCDPVVAAEFATAAAAKVVSRFGPRLTKQECAGLISEFFDD